MKRGFTLVEQMITVAIIGILGLLFEQIGAVSVRRAQEELQRARAGELLRALTGAEAQGRTLRPETLEKLQRGLPGVEVSRRAQGPAVTFVVRWTSPSGTTPEASLATFTKGGAR